ncbi:Lrp/AsnC family transcriptional regulator [Nocardia neocaledoniensis]|uniref:Lrp/AsnC family transcriptional regulator n=1 Tax=Nocardia neocaledoniensis TaxID=236511 RepID=UPI002458C10F|nr:Lrp/AsnC family transcriptional regulator [Nocardia neocaledoniensis]
MDSVRLDAVDLGLLHALQVDGRAAFSRIGEVLDVSDRTVARRFARLRGRGLLRVTGVADSGRIGRAEWLLRVRVKPGGAADLARTLARRPDTSWVSELAGGTEVICLFHVETEAAPVDALARHPLVHTVEAQRLLRHLTERRWHGRTSALSAEQVSALAPPVTERSGVIRMTDLDRRLLPALAIDGRADYARLARAVDWSESAVRRRLDELRSHRVLRFDVEIDAATLGFPTQAILWLTVAPARLLSVAGMVAAHPEAAFVGGTTGVHNLLVIVVCRDADALFTYLTERIGPIDGIERAETAPITAIAKRAAPLPR